MRRRRLAAAALWGLLAFLVWNVRFDLGVRQSASRYLEARGRYLQAQGPRVEMGAVMRAGIRESARAATLVAAPAAVVALWIAMGGRGPRR